MIQRIKGTQDLLPGEIEKWQFLEQQARAMFARYAYSEIRTPLFEETELFARSIGAETDIVQKEMYTFTDKSGKSLTLRPEGTAPVVRACIENGFFSGVGMLKLFYIGPMFRHERPQKGRYRQFYQIGAEVLGSDSPAVDCEVMEMLAQFLQDLGIVSYQLHINSIGCLRCRPLYLDALRERIARVLPHLCRDCNRRAATNPLRVLDCKVPADQEHIDKLPSSLEFLCEACSAHFLAVRKCLDARALAYRIDFRLVRGLDYYEKTTFEITSTALGAQNALLGGGRYDGLSQTLGGPKVSGFGFALGEERFVLALPERDYPEARPEVYLAPLAPECFERAAALASQLRRQGVRVLLEFENRSLKSQLRRADKLRVPFALILGPEELARNEVQCRDMLSGSQAVAPLETGAVLRLIRKEE